MATYTTGQARNGMYTTFQLTWDDAALGWQSITELTAEPYVQYENVRNEEAHDEVDTDQVWLRISVRHSTSESDSFGSGRANYEAIGRVFVEIFTPLNDGLILADDLVNVVKRAFQGNRAPGDFCGIVFEGATVNELGNEGGWNKTNVVISFRYDEAT